MGNQNCSKSFIGEVAIERRLNELNKANWTNEKKEAANAIVDCYCRFLKINNCPKRDMWY